MHNVISGGILPKMHKIIQHLSQCGRIPHCPAITNHHHLKLLEKKKKECSKLRDKTLRYSIEIILQERLSVQYRVKLGKDLQQ